MCARWNVALVALFVLLPGVAVFGAEASPTDVNPGTFAWSAITFVIVLFILSKTAWRPILNALDEREARIKESLEAADLARAETERLREEHEVFMAEARREATAIVEEGKRDAIAVKETIVTEARREAESMATRARGEIERAKDIAIDELHKRAVDLSYTIAEKLVRKSLAREDHEKLIDSTIDEYAGMT